MSPSEAIATSILGSVLDILISAAHAEDAGSYNVNLLEHEASGGHTVKLHIAKRLSFLSSRLRNNPNIEYASTFSSLNQARGIINKTLNEHHAEIQEMMNIQGDAWAIVQATFDSPTGYRLGRTKRGSREVYSVLVFLRKPGNTTEGFYILTAFPIDTPAE